MKLVFASMKEMTSPGVPSPPSTPQAGSATMSTALVTHHTPQPPRSGSSLRVEDVTVLEDGPVQVSNVEAASGAKSKSLKRSRREVSPIEWEYEASLSPSILATHIASKVLASSNGRERSHVRRVPPAATGTAAKHTGEPEVRSRSKSAAATNQSRGRSAGDGRTSKPAAKRAR